MKTYPLSLNKEFIFDFLFAAGVPRKLWTKGQKETFEKNKKLKMIEENYETDFNELHIDYSSKMRYRSAVEKVLDNVAQNSTVEGHDGKTLVTVPYKIAPISNRRFSTYDENIIGFYGGVRKAMEAPKGYLLLGADFPQIDGKGALYSYFKTSKVLEIAESTKDTYLVYKEIARYVTHLEQQHKLQEALAAPEYVDTKDLERRVQRFDPSIRPFDSPSQRGTYKVISLATTYNSVYSPFKAIQRATTYLKNALVRIGRYAYMTDVAEFLDSIGYPIVAKSRFGYRSPVVEIGKGGILAKLFNTPVQTTSSEIILMFICYIMDYFRGEGYGVDAIRVYVNRHDEPIFLIKEDVFVKEVNFIRDVSHILVEGWLPFEIGWNIGHSYGTNIKYYKDLLEAKPYDYTRINNEGAMAVNAPEPLLMEVPEMVAMTYRVLPDGMIICIMSRHIGEVNPDEYHFGGYKDSRKVEYTLFTANLTTETLTRKEVVTLVRNWVQGLDTASRYLIALGDGGGSQDLMVGEHSVFLTGKNLRLHRLNKTLLGAVMLKSFGNVATEDDHKFGVLLDQYTHIVTRRTL
jgi:hypothetical protein